MIFIRVLSKIFLWPHYSGAPGARAPVHWTAWTPGSYATVNYAWIWTVFSPAVRGLGAHYNALDVS